MTMPVRWSLLGLLLFLILFLLLSRVSFTLSSRSDNTSRVRHSKSSKPSSSLQLHQLQEEQHLRSRNAQIMQELEENDFQLELDCASPPSTLDLSSQPLSRDEKLLQDADFELELAFEVQRLVQRHQYDSTLLNESPSALQRHIERKLRYQKRLMSAYRASLHRQAALSYLSQECISWRAKQQQRLLASTFKDSHDQHTGSGSSHMDAAMTATSALTRFQQFHPNRHNLHPDSIFAQTLKALALKQYSDPKGFVVELDSAKVAAGSRRASAYQNDDIHVLVLDMQWDPEVTVVVGNVLDETVKLRQEGYRPVMLNVGNSVIPGGDYHLDTATDNEADLFRRTTLHQCLDQEPRRSKFYPISETGGIYCPNQAVFRQGRDNNNEFMDRFEWISVVSVAPIPKMDTREKDGGLGGVQFLEGEDDLLRRKILSAMKVGVSQGHDALVLPPHGTDVGQNPAEAIAAIYRSVIGRDFMGGRKRFQTYKKIIMVLDPEQADKIVNETSSYRPLQPPNVVATILPAGSETSNNSKGDDIAENDNEKVADAPGYQGGELTLERRFAQALDVDRQSPDTDSFEQVDQDDEDDEEVNEQSIRNRIANSNHNSGGSSDDPEFDQSEEDIELADGQEETALNVLDTTGEEAGEETEDSEGLPAEQLTLEDEVSESEALLEEQGLKEPDLSEVALDEDLSDSLQVPGAKNASDMDDDSSSDNFEDNDTEEPSVAEEVFVPITETVRQVFERMLETRSLLLIKNRARGMIEESENNKVINSGTSPQ